MRKVAGGDDDVNYYTLPFLEAQLTTWQPRQKERTDSYVYP